MDDCSQGQLAVRCADLPANRAAQVPLAGVPVSRHGQFRS